MPSRLFIGVAGWSLPASVSDRFGAGNSHLERYATRLNAVEINSSFYRPHRRSTYERWAASVPDSFRFVVKLPKAITHERSLVDCDDLLRRFADEMSGLGDKRGPVLVQLPPSHAFDETAAGTFFAQAEAALGGVIVCEPRHASWFSARVDTLLADHRVARVAADPPVVPGAAQPGGWNGISYFRLHGAPQVYRSNYSLAALSGQAAVTRTLLAENHEVWTMFDNTAAGYAPANALALAADCASGGVE